MVVTFAVNQTLVATNGSAVVVTTDPVPMKRFDRATANLLVHAIWATGSSSPTISYVTQVSNDGVHWLDGGPGDSASAASPVPRQVVGEAHGAYIRCQFVFELSGGTSGDVGAVTFDLHTRLDHE